MDLVPSTTQDTVYEVLRQNLEPTSVRKHTRVAYQLIWTKGYYLTKVRKQQRTIFVEYLKREIYSFIGITYKTFHLGSSTRVEHPQQNHENAISDPNRERTL